MSRWPGGLIRKTQVTPAGPFQDGAAKGVWTIMEAAYWIKQGLWPIAGNLPPSAFYTAGDGNSSSNIISKIIVATTGNATNFGNLSFVTSYTPQGVSSSTRGVIAGGQNGGNVIQYLTLSSSGNTQDFGDLYIASLVEAGSASNGTRGVFYQGFVPSTSSRTNVIQYITIASTGDSSDFGDGVSSAQYNSSGMCNSSTRGVFGGYYDGSYMNVISYITIATTGDALDFGDLTNIRAFCATHSSVTRGLFMGGAGFPEPPNAGNVNTIDYVTIASTGNATDFGDLTTVGYYKTGAGSQIRALCNGGTNNTNSLDYITIATTGDALDFGDLVTVSSRAASMSSSHGGL